MIFTLRAREAEVSKAPSWCTGEGVSREDYYLRSESHTLRVDCRIPQAGDQGEWKKLKERKKRKGGT